MAGIKTASGGSVPAQEFGPWNPGIHSAIPLDLLPLATIFRSENALGSLASVMELRGLTGLALAELVSFRPQRLALHELLIRITADFVVPDGEKIGDLGINFREIAQRLLDRHLQPHMEAIVAAYQATRAELRQSIETAFKEIAAPAQQPTAPARRWHRRVLRLGRRAEPSATVERGWGPQHIASCQRLAETAQTQQQRSVYRALARVMSALFATQGHAWGSHDLIVSIATDLACNDYGSDVVGRSLDALLPIAAVAEGYRLLPRQELPVVINTKGASASGKSTLRPLQKKLTEDIGVTWTDFALISPDIWRKQLLDYNSLGAAHKYAGAFTGDELQIVDQKLDRYMARKHGRGEMTHLLIDRFRFDSFAPDSNEEGSNLLTRFGQSVYLFFMITPPEQLVERAWKRGLEFGRYKAVDDTLGHSVQAYSGIPDVFFTWVGRGDKRIQFEFLDNTVPLGERPRTVAFGDNHVLNVLHVGQMLNIERFGRVNVDAGNPEALYRNTALLKGEMNAGFLARCAAGFREVNFADQTSGRIYLRLEAGAVAWIDAAEFAAAIADADTKAALTVIAPGAFDKSAPLRAQARWLEEKSTPTASLLGHWGHG